MELLELVKTSLNIPITDTEYDSYLEQLIYFVKKQFTNLTGVELLGAKNITEVFLKQYGVSIFKIPKGPINSIVSVVIDGESQDISTFYINNQFVVSDSDLYGEKIEITVNVGYDVIPDEINYILSAMCEYYFKQDSKSNYFTGDKPLTPAMNILPGYIREMVESYVI